MLRENRDARVERILGTEIYITSCGDYLDIFMNPCLTFRERELSFVPNSVFIFVFGDYGGFMEIIVPIV